ncbi:SCO family protein [Microvirga sp. VF16]|uniref:SCO family protein n=1 Tax=Microvirga sp. VF16 TaxID=2807101 RepID=UPI0035304447
MGGAFRLESHKGEIVTNQSLKGRPAAVFFGFTYCPEVCPTALIDLSGLLQELGADGDKITPVFITVDPERDTRPVLAEYMQAFDPRIIALTGSLADVDTAAKAFKVFYRKVPDDLGGYTMDHSAAVYLMDREGRFAGSLDKHEPKEAKLRKLRALIGNSSPT